MPFLVLRVQVNKGVRVLGLSWNKIRSAGAADLIALISKKSHPPNCPITHLDLQVRLS